MLLVFIIPTDAAELNTVKYIKVEIMTEIDIVSINMKVK